MTTALLVMDFQQDIIGRVAEPKPLLERTAQLIAAARAAGAPIVYVIVGFRPGYPEVDPNNAAFSTIRSTGRFQTTTPGSDILAEVAPAPHDVIVMKHRVGAFLGTDLDQVLRARRVDTLVLAGISTSGVVLSTVRHAADADYKIVVAADCCADPDPEVHRVLIEKVFPRQARVASGGDVTFAA